MNEEDLGVLGLLSPGEIYSCTNSNLLYVSYFYRKAKSGRVSASEGELQYRYTANKHTPISVIVDILENLQNEHIPLLIAEESTSSEKRLLAVMNSSMGTSSMSLIKALCAHKNLSIRELYDWAVLKQEFVITEYLFKLRKEEMDLLILKLTDLRYSELEALSLPMKHKLIGVA